MHVRTRIPAPTDGTLSWWVKCVLDGMALGCVPSWNRWRLPPLYESGVRFAYEPNHGDGNEEFAQPTDVYARQWGDCDDLVVYRVAELLSAELPHDWESLQEKGQRRVLTRIATEQAAGKLPCVSAIWRGSSIHVRVRLPDGSLEDPSILLGAPT